MHINEPPGSLTELFCQSQYVLQGSEQQNLPVCSLLCFQQLLLICQREPGGSCSHTGQPEGVWKAGKLRQKVIRDGSAYGASSQTQMALQRTSTFRLPTMAAPGLSKAGF